MSERQKWFVILEQGHKGPFSDSEIQDLYMQKQVQLTTLLWNRHSNSEVSVKQFFDQLMLPPGLPEQLQKSHSVKEEVEAQSLQTKTYEEEPQTKREMITPFYVKLWKFGPRLMLILAIFILLLLSYDIYYFTFFQKNRPASLPMIYYKVFERVQGEARDQNQLAIALSKDANQLFAGTNVRLNGKLQLEFKSVRQQTLHDSEIEFSSVGKLFHRFYESDKINFTKGDKIYPGYYQVSGRLLEIENPYFLIGYFLKLAASYEFSTKLLIGSSSPALFAKQLKKFQRELEFGDRQFFSDLVQKSETLLQLTQDTKERFLATLDLLQNPDEKLLKVTQFETWYMQNQGTFFTKFVIENNLKFKKIQQAGSEHKELVVNFYTQMNNYVKRIGDISVGFLMDLFDYANGKKLLDIEATKVRVAEAYDLFTEQVQVTIDQIKKTVLKEEI